MNGNWHFRVLAIVLALFSWYQVTGRESVERLLEIPVVISGKPENMIILEGMQGKIEVRISGPKGIVRGLDAADLQYDLDLSDLEPGGREIVFDPDNFSLSRALKVVDIRPGRVQLQVDQAETKQVPVSPFWKAALDADWRLIDADTKPDQVTLSGPKSLLNKVTEIKTQPLQVEGGRPREIKQSVDLQLPPFLDADPRKVDVDLVFGPVREPVWIKIPIKVVGPGSEKLRSVPTNVRLLVDAPRYLLKKGRFADMAEAVVSTTGQNHGGSVDRVYRISLPHDAELLEAKPSVVNLLPKRE